MARQILSTREDRKIWGRCIASYPDAFGTGYVFSDKVAESVGSDGHLHIFVPVEKSDVLDALRSESESDSNRLMIDQYPLYSFSMLGYFFDRGLMKRKLWVGVVKIGLLSEPHRVEREIRVGFLDAHSVVGLFDRFDEWRAGEYAIGLELDGVIEFAP